jgi:hypothetical protein
LNPFARSATKEIEENITMHLRVRLAALAVSVAAVCAVLGASPASAAVCQDKSMTLDEIVAIIDASRGCEQAMKIFQDCEFGASGDVQLGAAVEKKCAADFQAHLEPAQQQSYRREMRVCDGKYRNQSGTMYLSFTAFCRAEVAQRYSRRALKAVR